MSATGADQLDAFLDKLEQLATKSSPSPPDAIDQIRAGPRRTTRTRSIRHHPDMEHFRQEMADGLIRADTANQLFRLITSVLAQLT